MSYALSPIHSLGCGYIFTMIMIVALWRTGFYNDSQYFQWGPPVTFFDHLIETDSTFYSLLLLVFFHQIITNWIYEVVYPWIINNVQNPRQETLDYSKFTCLTIVNLHSLYNQIHLAFIVIGITSQLSFLIALILADFLSLSFINWSYVKDKKTMSLESNTSPELDLEMAIPN